MTTAELLAISNNPAVPQSTRDALRRQISARDPKPVSGAGSLRRFRVPGKMTETEGIYAARLDAQKSAGQVRSWKFERLNLKLDDPGTGRALTYRPDFLVWHADGSVTLDEVKGGYITDKGMLKFRLAVDIYPELHLRMWQYVKGVWTLLRETAGKGERA